MTYLFRCSVKQFNQLLFSFSFMLCIKSSDFWLWPLRCSNLQKGTIIKLALQITDRFNFITGFTNDIVRFWKIINSSLLILKIENASRYLLGICTQFWKMNVQLALLSVIVSASSLQHWQLFWNYSVNFIDYL